MGELFTVTMAVYADNQYQLFSILDNIKKTLGVRYESVVTKSWMLFSGPRALVKIRVETSVEPVLRGVLQQPPMKNRVKIEINAVDSRALLDIVKEILESVEGFPVVLEE